MQTHDQSQVEEERVIGATLCQPGEIVLNEGRRRAEIVVRNTGDRPVQVGSHFHFFEVNPYLSFERRKAFGMRLDIPSGTAVRFEPGEAKRVTLVEYGGRQVAYGFNGLTMGSTRDPHRKDQAVALAMARGFRTEVADGDATS